MLPVLTLTVVGVASFSRYMRSSAIESLAQDYIRTARAKGVTQKGVLLGHMLQKRDFADRDVAWLEHSSVDVG